VDSPKLLVVEDDSASLELMAEVFTSLEATVHPVNDSEAAAARIGQQKFDGIFLDLEMPKLHGFDLTQKIRKSSWNKTTPVVIVTGHDDRETMQQAFAAGATFFLQKPVDRQKLSGLFRTVRGAIAENRRRTMRVPMQTDVRCTVGSREMRGQTWNLSQGGIQIEVGDLAPGTLVRLCFRLPASSTVVDASGTVVWSKPDRQGIQFTHLSNHHQEEIRRFLTRADESSSS